MKRYSLFRIGNLLATRGAVTGPGGTKVLNLLVDTGSTYTILPVEALEGIGCSPAESREHLRIITGSGVIIAPKVTVQQFHAMGHRREEFELVAHSLPFSSFVDGLLGMDFLMPIRARINLADSCIEIP